MSEWIVTNGLGGYASLSNQLKNLRKYHGLLISSLNPPTERWVFVSNVYEKLKLKDMSYNLNKIRPTFNFFLFPTFSYDFGEIKFKKTVLMEHGKNTTIIRYQIETNEPLIIDHSPIVNSRHFYDVTNHRYLSFQHDGFDSIIKVKPSNIDKTIKLILMDSKFTPLHYWEEYFYEIDRARNEAWVDNTVQIGKFEKPISNSCEYYLILTLEDNINIDPSEIYLKEIQRKKNILETAGLSKEFNKLVIATDNFIVNKGYGKSVIAGYHWFSDWGRDTLISLPGLALVTKRFSDAKEILRSFSKYQKNGLIPNNFGERDSKAVYNTVDASLWYIDRVYQYLKYTNDVYFLDEIWNTLQAIIDAYYLGTDHGISMTDDFLISHDPGLTWMDVKIGEYYPTPRAKKAVEIQALWYNDLKIMSKFANMVGKDDIYYGLSEKVQKSFNEQYTQQYDVIDTKDQKVRPNQIFLVSLDFNMINEQMQKNIVTELNNKLLTIFGLRTLSPDDQSYKGKYIGEYNKDIAYHNGTVWPWLLGPFITSYIKIKKGVQTSREFAFNNYLKPMLDVFGENWDGSINEIFDGDPIYEPRGCISQAWSVAEILRTWVEDIENIRPKYEKTFLSSKIRV